jgi:hypothetical protein
LAANRTFHCLRRRYGDPVPAPRAHVNASTGPKSPSAGASACGYRLLSALICAVARHPAITSWAMTGVIDIVTLQALARCSDTAELTAKYGFVVADECWTDSHRPGFSARPEFYSARADRYLCPFDEGESDHEGMGEAQVRLQEVLAEAGGDAAGGGAAAPRVRVTGLGVR